MSGNLKRREETAISFFGIVQFSINHKNLTSFNSKLESIGTLKMLPGLKKSGSLSGLSTFEDLEAEFLDLEKRLRIFGDKKYPVKVLCDL